MRIQYQIASTDTVTLNLFLFPAAGPSEIKAEESKDERELTEEERKQKIKDELGEDVLKMLEGSESQGEGAVPTIDEPCKKCKGNDKKLCKECGCMKCGGKTPPEQVISIQNFSIRW